MPASLWRYIGVELAIGALEIGVGDHAGRAMARACHEQDVRVPLTDDAVQVDIEKIQSRHGAPMAQQARLGVIPPERLAQQWIGEQIDLTDG